METRIARPVHSAVVLPQRLARLVLWIAAACTFGAILVAAGGLYGAGISSGAAVRSSFSGRVYPVRPIEYERDPKSGNRLVRVRCAGHAKTTSLCWVSRP
jgi:hypothetical protein